MACTLHPAGPGVTIITCTRGERRKRCSVESCPGHAIKLCDWPLTGRATGRTCDRDLCGAHATSAGESLDYCPTHARMAAQATENPCPTSK